jgi:hypothetical protein
MIKDSSKLEPVPTPTVLEYVYCSTRCCYLIENKTADFKPLPDELKVSEAIKPTIKHYAPKIIQATNNNGKKFHTKMQPVTPFDNVFFGDDGYLKQPESLILFIFSKTGKRLIASFFHGFYPKNIQGKHKAIEAYLNSLEK